MAGKQAGHSLRNSIYETDLYSVGEVCDMVGTTRKTLFYYDQIGLLTPTRREGAQKVKQYDSSRIKRLRKILEYRDAGLSIAEIRELLDDKSADHLAVMERALSRMMREKKDMEETIRNLEKLIRKEKDKTDAGPG